MTHNVSNMEIILYLNNKLLALEAQAKSIREAISLFEEAEQELLTAPLERIINVEKSKPEVIPELEEALETYSDEQLGVKKIKTVVDVNLHEIAKNMGEEMVNQAQQIQSNVEMTTREFLTSLKELRKKSGKSLKEVASGIGFGDKYKNVWAIENNGTKVEKHIISLSKFYNIKLIDLDKGGIVGTVKTIKTANGVKRTYTRTTDPLVNTTTNGQRVKKKYNKREPKPKPIDDSA